MPMHPRAQDGSFAGERAREIVDRVQELVTLNQTSAPNRAKVRDIMNGGAEGIARLVGHDVNPDHADLIPAANHMLKAADRMGQKIGKRPDTKVDAPGSETDDRARKKADKRAQIVDSYDRAVKLKLQLPQAGRWLPAYGFVPWVIKQREDLNGDPFPALELRDPYNAYPGVWTVHQQPHDIAFRHVIPIKTLENMYPDIIAKKRKGGVASAGSVDYLPRESGGVVLGGHGTPSTFAPSWSNQAAAGEEVYEYYDQYGCWWVLADGPEILSYTPNLMARPAFVVMKRFAFDRLMGQYDQLIGLIAAQARLNVLAIAAAEDTVNTETNVIGDMVAGKYQRGKRAVNYLAPGSQVQKTNDRLPLEVFNQIDRIERQTRNMATYPVTDDAVSPNSFVTEVGLTELQSSIEDEYNEYRLVKGSGLEDADSLRLEWIETYYPDATFHMEGMRDGSAFAGTYRPSTHIKGQYRTRRVYGAMAGFDDSNKIVVGGVLQDKGIIDTDTFREQVDGLEDHQRIKERIHNERIEQILYQMMGAGAEQLDPRIINLIIEELPEGDRKELFRELFEEDEEEQQQMGPEGQPGGPGEVPDVSTVLNRLTTGGEPTAGLQTIGR